MNKRTPELRFNGCGFAFLGIKNDGEILKGTYWFTLLYLPIVPIMRATIAYPQTHAVIATDRERPHLREVLRTYLFGWLIFPITLITPFVIGVGLYPVHKTVGLFIAAVGVLWFGVCVLKLADWNERRKTRPRQSSRA